MPRLRRIQLPPRRARPRQSDAKHNLPRRIRKRFQRRDPLFRLPFRIRMRYPRRHLRNALVTAKLANPRSIRQTQRSQAQPRSVKSHKPPGKKLKPPNSKRKPTGHANPKVLSFAFCVLRFSARWIRSRSAGLTRLPVRWRTARFHPEEADPGHRPPCGKNCPNAGRQFAAQFDQPVNTTGCACATYAFVCGKTAPKSPPIKKAPETSFQVSGAFLSPHVINCYVPGKPFIA